ncbi:MAG TPA: hypothetical protein VMU83_01940 [Hanamia sp.]|nr:hypothetical protein [Hanamia sp.]
MSQNLNLKNHFTKTKSLFRLTILVVSFSTVLLGCKKDNSNSSTNGSTAANIQTSSDDLTMVSNESHAVSDDAVAALNGNVSVSGRTAGIDNIDITVCDAKITYDTTSATRTITIVYNGSNCSGNRTRTGTVTIAVPQGQHWNKAGSVVTITIDALTITRVRDGKKIIINGTKTITNTSGGLIQNLATLDSIENDVSSNLSITFASGLTCSWQTSKHRVFTYNNGIVETVTGTHSDGTNNNIATWGTDRFGISFTHMITSPKVFAQSCDFELTSGEDLITRSDNISCDITYGLDASGNIEASCPITSAGGYYYAKLVWSNGNNGKEYTFIYPY